MIAEWLRSTVLGVIVLGAVGSLAAVGVLALLRWLMSLVMPHVVARVSEWLGKHDYVSGYLHGSAFATQRWEVLLAYQHFRTVQLMVTLALGCAAGLGVAGLMVLEPPGSHSVLASCLAGIAFLSAYVVVRVVLDAWLPYRAAARPVLRSGEQSLAEEKAQEALAAVSGAPSSREAKQGAQQADADEVRDDDGSRGPRS